MLLLRSEQAESAKGKMMKAILIDPNSNNRDSIIRGLFLLGHDCVGYSDTDSALEMLKTPEGESIHLVITCLEHRQSSIINFIHRALETRPGLKLIAIAGLNNVSQIDAVQNKGGMILRMPFGPDDLNEAILAVTGPIKNPKCISKG